MAGLFSLARSMALPSSPIISMIARALPPSLVEPESNVLDGFIAHSDEAEKSQVCGASGTPTPEQLTDYEESDDSFSGPETYALPPGDTRPSFILYLADMRQRHQGHDAQLTVCRDTDFGDIVEIFNEEQGLDSGGEFRLLCNGFWAGPGDTPDSLMMRRNDDTVYVIPPCATCHLELQKQKGVSAAPRIRPISLSPYLEDDAHHEKDAPYTPSGQRSPSPELDRPAARKVARKRTAPPPGPREPYAKRVRRGETRMALQPAVDLITLGPPTGLDEAGRVELRRLFDREVANAMSPATREILRTLANTFDV